MALVAGARPPAGARSSPPNHRIMTKVIKSRAKRSAKKARKRPAGRAGPSRAGLGKKLVVVESPAKAKTINKYLGRDYVVRASMGHVRDLPAREMGVDVEKNFTPTYETIQRRQKVLKELDKYAKAASDVFLATDLDREGEAIAWHLAKALRLPARKIHRVVFNEITASAIRAAFAAPHDIDMNKVSAQQARRILDRLVGYELSPLLWRKVAAGLSAGRVQTVALKIIVEREREIEAFMPEEYWRIGAVFTPELRAAPNIARQWRELLAKRDRKGRGPTREVQQQFLGEQNAFQAELARWKGRKFRADNADDALEVMEALGIRVKAVERTEDPEGKGPAANVVRVATAAGRKAARFTVTDLQQRERRSNPPAPFTTASLQQTAAIRLHFSASRTMRAAQQLYEGIDVPGEGSVGLITYMRTDGTHVSGEAIGRVRSLIADSFGRKYLPEKAKGFASGRRAQEAHEAVRPTDVTRAPEDLRSCLKGDQFKLYQLIWQRFVACQMMPAVWNVTDATITAETPAGQAEFKAIGRRLAFDGYLKVAGVPRGGDQTLPELVANQRVAPVDVTPTQHFTQPPPRYTEASLIKALEADGIGRPSTYAIIIQTIQSRQYARLEDRSFHPTHLGMVVTDKLVKHFPQLFDVRFTADMEDQLDRIEEAKADWARVLKKFYGPFSKTLKKAAKNMVHAKAETQPSDHKCEACGKPMVYRFSKTGRYLACTGYPECKETHPVDKDGNRIRTKLTDVACPKCGKSMALREGRYGPFLSCSTYPECDGVVNLDRKGLVKPPSRPPLQVDLPCPKCEAPLNLRRSKRGPWLGCSKFPKCRGRQAWKTLTDDQTKALERQLAEHEKAEPLPVLKDLSGRPIRAGYTPQEIPQEDINR